MTKRLLGAIALVLAGVSTHTNIAEANTSSKKPMEAKEYLVKLTPGAAQNIAILNNLARTAGKAEVLMEDWVKITDTHASLDLQSLANNREIEYIQPNYKIQLIEDYKTKDQAVLKAVAQYYAENHITGLKPDNPAIPAAPQPGSGEDPLFNKQWGMIDNHVKDAWKASSPSPILDPMNLKPMIVAVIDTGVDYTHEDLLPNN